MNRKAAEPGDTDNLGYAQRIWEGSSFRSSEARCLSFIVRQGMSFNSSIFFVAASVFAALSLFARLLTGRAHRASPRRPDIPATFRVGSWLLWFYSSFLGVCVALAAGVITSEFPAKGFFVTFPACFAVLAIAGLIVDSRKRVTIDERSLAYRSLFGSFDVPLCSIRLVYAANGFIVIDVGAKRRRIIPIIFRDSGNILRLLNERNDIQAAEPDATDNPGDAQRLREDH